MKDENKKDKLHKMTFFIVYPFLLYFYLIFPQLYLHPG